MCHIDLINFVDGDLDEWSSRWKQTSIEECGKYIAVVTEYRRTSSDRANPITRAINQARCCIGRYLHLHLQPPRVLFKLKATHNGTGPKELQPDFIAFPSPWPGWHFGKPLNRPGNLEAIHASFTSSVEKCILMISRTALRLVMFCLLAHVQNLVRHCETKVRTGHPGHLLLRTRAAMMYLTILDTLVTKCQVLLLRECLPTSFRGGQHQPIHSQKSRFEQIRSIPRIDVPQDSLAAARGHFIGPRIYPLSLGLDSPWQSIA